MVGRTTATEALGEPSVIVVSAPHRDEAFAAAREAIDRIEAEVPIWKRELAADEPTLSLGLLPPARGPEGRRRRLAVSVSRPRARGA